MCTSLRLYMLLLFAWWFTRRRGLGHAVAYARKQFEWTITHQRRDVSEVNMETILEHLQRASRWCPYQPRCLERSLVLSLYLLSLGIPAGIKIGVRRPGFRAHCWVEVNSQVIGDDPSVVNAYATIIGVP